MMRIAIVLAALSAPTLDVSAAPPAVPVPAVSTAAAAVPMTPSELYRSQRLPDPFLPPGAGGAIVQMEEATPGEFSIHNLVLRGILRDSTGDYAILADAVSNVSYILKNGRLYDSKRKPVPGVTGIVKPRQKTVHLMTPEKDVQTLILGEDYKEKEGL